ncbi:MAG: membrane protein insertion efficiency factor YidD [Bacteroidales bacterium]|nr:membrane protein insertion efficiency factor YidD [Bacteroidales bacterium]
MRRSFVITKFFIFLIIGNIAVAQNATKDLSLIINDTDIQDHYETKKTKFLLPKSKNPIVKYNPISLVLGSTMYVYQGFFSKQLFASCLFSPSCSEMSKHFIRDFGIVKGIALSADRLTRCNRISGHNVHTIRINEHDHKIHEKTEMFKVKKK